jgi:hypothetical protein
LGNFLHRQAKYCCGTGRGAAASPRLSAKPETHTGPRGRHTDRRRAEAIGSLFVVNVGTRAEAKAFSDGDPFTQTGVFASITITRMRKGQWNPEAAEGA